MFFNICIYIYKYIYIYIQSNLKFHPLLGWQQQPPRTSPPKNPPSSPWVAKAWWIRSGDHGQCQLWATLTLGVLGGPKTIINIINYLEPKSGPLFLLEFLALYFKQIEDFYRFQICRNTSVFPEKKIIVMYNQQFRGPSYPPQGKFRGHYVAYLDHTLPPP